MDYLLRLGLYKFTLNRLDSFIGKSASSEALWGKRGMLSKARRMFPALLMLTLFSTAAVSETTAIPANQKGVTWHWQSWQQKDGVVNWTGVTADLQAMQAAGITWARVHIGPEMSDAMTDRLVAMAASKDIKFVALMASTADEAAQESPEYLARVARKYTGRVNVWEIGNEQNNSQYWSLKDGRDAQVKHYVLYLQAAYRAMKGAAPHATVLMGGLMAYNVEAFLPEFIRLGGGKYTDGFAIHPYAASPASVVDRLETIEREISSDENLRNKPVWITEIGFFANEPAWNNAGRVDDEVTKARYLTETMQLLRKHGIKTPIFWYSFHEAKPDVCGYSLVLYRPEGKIVVLPAYEAYRLLPPVGRSTVLAHESNSSGSTMCR